MWIVMEESLGSVRARLELSDRANCRGGSELVAPYRCGYAKTGTQSSTRRARYVALSVRRFVARKLRIEGRWN